MTSTHRFGNRPMPSNYRRPPLSAQAIAAFYQGQGLTLRGQGAWCSAVCPFHKDTRPSLRIHRESGAFRCMSCGARGGGPEAFEAQCAGRPRTLLAGWLQRIGHP